MKKIPNCSCGNKAKFIDSDGWLHVVGCTVCKLKTSEWNDVKDAFTEWKDICSKKEKIENSMIIDVAETMAIDYNVRNWCTMPYPGHSKGCPNFGKKETCPPKIGLIDNLFDLSKEHWFAVVKFDLAGQVNRMANIHPEWSDRQCRCCLYWQGGVRKNLKKLCNKFLSSKSGLTFSFCPEAMGVNVFRTFHRNGIMMRKNPKDIVYKVALIGTMK